MLWARLSSMNTMRGCAACLRSAFDKVAAYLGRLLALARTLRCCRDRFRLDRELPARLLVCGGELAMRDAEIVLVLELDREAGLREAADDERFVDSPFELVAVSQPLQEPLGQLRVWALRYRSYARPR